MTSEKRFKILIYLTIILVFFSVLSNIFGEYIHGEFTGYIKRMVYYERVISKKGLSLHKALYWRKED